MTLSKTIRNAITLDNMTLSIETLMTLSLKSLNKITFTIMTKHNAAEENATTIYIL